jgi:hypothetical protein
VITPLARDKLSEGDTVFTRRTLVGIMEWTPTAAPAMLNACDCGSDSVEVRPDGLVKLYRCADCESILGDITMGHEP